MEHKLALITLLGLAATASDGEIEKAFNEFQSELANRGGGETDGEEAEALKNRVAELEESNKKLLTEQVERDLLEYADVIENKEEVKAALLANREATIKLLKGAKAKLSNRGGGAKIGKQPLHNREQAGIPATKFTEGTNPQDEARAKKIANRAQEIARAQKCPYQRAFAMASAEFPAE